MSKADFPYIGVTGFMRSSSVSSILAPFPLPKLVYRLMVGVLVSSKTMAGRPNKWPGRYPKIQNVKDIFFEDDFALNLVHYNTDDSRRLYMQLVELHHRVGPALDGFQLNIAWPDILDIQQYYENYGQEKYLVLQVGAKAMAQCDNNPRHISDQLGEYVPMIDYVLIDPSGGLGRPFDPELAGEILRSIHSDHPDFKLGIAGGFGPNSMEHLKPIAKEFPGISIDAEGKLRTPQPEDQLDMDAVRDYITQASEILK